MNSLSLSSSTRINLPDSFPSDTWLVGNRVHGNSHLANAGEPLAGRRMLTKRVQAVLGKPARTLEFVHLLLPGTQMKMDTHRVAKLSMELLLFAGDGAPLRPKEKENVQKDQKLAANPPGACKSPLKGPQLSTLYDRCL